MLVIYQIYKFRYLPDIQNRSIFSNSFILYHNSYRSRDTLTKLSMSKPTYVLVPGAWHSPEIYKDVVDSLAKHGYPTISLALPSVGATPALYDFSEDVTAIRSCLAELVSQDKDVILVVHSYAGLPGGEATKDLGKKEREAQGLKGGIIRYVVINGFIVPAGFQPAPRGDFSTMPEWMRYDPEVSKYPYNSSLAHAVPAVN
jgi:alpha-beta hydrolase superfamily lysophospholipase